MHVEGNILKVDDKEYELTPGLRILILYKKPRPRHYTSDDYSVHKAIVAQTRVGAYPNKHTVCARSRSHGNGSICSGVWLYPGIG